MPESGKFLEYTGHVDYKIIDQLLEKFKKKPEFINLDKPTGNRVYAILVECLENISKYSVKKPAGDFKIQPTISVRKLNDKIIIKAGNPVTNDKTGELTMRLNQVNLLDEKALSTLYENTINKKMELKENGAGLGFILMKLKSGNEIAYNFTRINSDHTYFELKISVNEYIMRKLIIEQTSSSPHVILDPDKNFFEISGESRPPDVTDFYAEILNWTNDYFSYLGKSKENIKPVFFNLDLEYFNSSSAKYLLDFCKQIAAARSKGMDLTVRWHYEENDIDMLDAGKEMSRIAKFPFEYMQKDKK